MKLIQANVVELAANAVRTATFTGAGVEAKDFDGPCHFILQSSAATAGTLPTLNVKLQHSDAVGSGYEDAGVAFSAVTTTDLTEMLTIQVGSLKRFIRVVATIGGTATPTFGFGVSMLGNLHAGRNASQSI